MSMDPEIRDQAYQFFIEEAPELLEAIEAGLLTLKPEIDVAQLHSLMRAAHSIKGGAASVGLVGIKSLAHRLETIFKALYSDQVVLDTVLETQLLQAFDCLRLPLEAQVKTGIYDEAAALAVAEPIFQEIESRLGAALDQADNFILSSSDLGIDMVASIFEIDVQQGLEHLKKVLHQPQNHEVLGELRAQTEVFAGFASLLNLPGFGKICEVATQATERDPGQILAILQQAILDFEMARALVLAGDRTQGGTPSEQLLALAQADQPKLSGEETQPELLMGNAPDLTPAFIQDTDDLAVIFDEAEPSPTDLEAIDFDLLMDDNSLANLLPALDFSLDALTSERPVSEETSLDTKDWQAVQANSDSKVLEVDTSGAEVLTTEEPDNLELTIQAIGNIYDNLPVATELPTPTFLGKQAKSAGAVIPAEKDTLAVARAKTPQKRTQIDKTLTARIALNRLERMDNFVGELAINRNGLSLQNEQFQRTVRNLKRRFGRFRGLAKQLQTLSDKMLVSPERINAVSEQLHSRTEINGLVSETEFDALEMDTYSAVNLLLEELLEELLQVEEGIEDVNLFAGQSNQKLEKQRQLLTQLRDELMWSRMVPLNGVLNRFPRVLKELSSTYQKSVQLKLVGSEVLVDRVMLEKLYDPLLHLLRNSFDHGIEAPEARIKQGKPAEGTIEIRAYHQGNNTVIEVQDDGRGLDLVRIGQRAVEAGFLSAAELSTARKQQLYNYIFEPGFSTAPEISELSGRGVGLDIVRERLNSFNGKISLTSEPGQGTTFVLRIPLTLTLSKLIIVGIGATILAIPSDGVEEILMPLGEQMKESVGQRFLLWRNQLVPTYSLESWLPYFCPIPEKNANDIPVAIASRYRTTKPLLITQRDQEVLALEVDQIITEQELVVKPFGKTIAAPDYMNGCTVLGDGRLVPVIDGAGVIGYNSRTVEKRKGDQSSTTLMVRSQAPTILIIDDSSALRRTLALTLQKAGYPVIQAKDGREALEQLQQGSPVQLIVCDIEMPRMNGFEFLSQRRLNPEFVKIPTLMLTSRSSQKHRSLAFQLGATDYFSKPYIEADFLAAIKTHLQISPASSPVTLS